MPPDIINGLFGLGGALIGAFSVYFSARRVMGIKTKQEAGAKLRAAFAPAIAKYPLVKNTEIDALLWAELPNQAIAIEEFRHYVPCKSRDAYQKAWDDYHIVAGSVRFFDYYMGENPAEVFKQRINAIFKFTE